MTPKRDPEWQSWQSPVLVGPSEAVYEYLVSIGKRPMTMVPLSYVADLLLFQDKIGHVRRVIPTGISVDVPDMETLRSSKVFLSKDGKAGGAVSEDGRLFAMFRLPGSELDIHNLIGILVSQGADHLSCLDTFLPGIYSEFGFYPVYRQKFDPELAPDWDPTPFLSYDDQGTPDSVKMERDASGKPEFGTYSYKKGDLFPERWSGKEWWT